ncbi:MAG: amino acid racemase [Coriobacteriales bacterium]|jgi:aspartate racemase|nr:amino acid racemase [Coriobacteriales bacterium]
MLIGVLGGMGPEASALFYRMVIEHTQASCDQEHLDMLVYSHASMPDRTAALQAGAGEQLLSALLADVTLLERAGAEAICITCNTSHVFAAQIAEAAAVPFLDMVQLAADAALARFGAGSRVAVLATDGTLGHATYQRALEQRGLQPCLPSQPRQRQVMSLIYDGVKAGGSIDAAAIQAIDAELQEQGCDGAILACTELSVLAERFASVRSGFYLDAMLCLARRTIEFAGKEYR